MDFDTGCWSYKQYIILPQLLHFNILRTKKEAPNNNKIVNELVFGQ